MRDGDIENLIYLRTHTNF